MDTISLALHVTAAAVLVGPQLLMFFAVVPLFDAHPRRVAADPLARRGPWSPRVLLDVALAVTLETLPDLLCPALDLVFVGINPGERSAERGHYYAHPGNAFWRELSAS